MKGKSFIDTNLIIYLYSDDEPDKKVRIEEILESLNPIISTQVLSEISNVMLRKYKLGSEAVLKIVDELCDNFTIVEFSFVTIKKALFLQDRYKYSYYDSLIIATALENNCDVLYSEDMQDGQIIEDSLVIKNPLK